MEEKTKLVDTPLGKLHEEEKDMPEDIKQIRTERDTLRKENFDLRAQLKKAEENLVHTETSLHELMSKTGAKLPTPPYEYGENECRPVGLGGTCDKCGWVRDTQMKPGDQLRSAHAIL